MPNVETIYVYESWKDKVVVASNNNALFYGDKKLTGGNGTKYIDNYDESKNRAVIDGENGVRGYLTKK